MCYGKACVCMACTRFAVSTQGGIPVLDLCLQWLSPHLGGVTMTRVQPLPCFTTEIRKHVQSITGVNSALTVIFFASLLMPEFK